MLCDTTIVIPQFNQAKLTCACLESLRRHETELWPVVVVDDGSERECLDAIEGRGFSGVEVVSQPHMGVTAAWNRGASRARTRFVVFLNNDVLFDGPAVERLLEPLRAGESGMAGVRFRDELWLPEAVLRGLPARQFLEGWCFAVAVETVRAVGGFDEGMRLYWSDSDFQLRVVRRHAGRGTALDCPAELPLRHLGHRTVRRQARREEIWRADREAFLAKWGGADAPSAAGL